MGRQGNVERKDDGTLKAKELDINARLERTYEQFVKKVNLGEFLQLGLGPSTAVPRLLTTQNEGRHVLPKPVIDKRSADLVGKAYVKSNLLPPLSIVDTMGTSVSHLNRELTKLKR